MYHRTYFMYKGKKILKTTVKLALFMIISSIILPSSIEAEQKILYQNRDISQNNTLNENRPVHRNYPYGGTLVWGTSNPPTIINPILTTHSVSSSLMELIFDSLVRINGRGELVPGLAHSWKISADGLEYTFYLNKGVRFHDGTELTAKDVKFTYDLINDPANSSHWRANTDLTEQWKIIDDYTIKLILKRPFPFILYNLVREIMSKDAVENQDLRNASFNYHPMGTGPFIFKSWDRKTNQIELIANPYYFEGRPYLDKIIVKTFPNIPELWSAFMRQEVNFVKFISREDYLAIKDDPTFHTYKIIGEVYYAVVYNLNDPILSDIHVRKAIVYAINKKEIIDNVLNGYGIESTGPFHPESIGYNPNVKPIEHNPIKARDNLFSHGWQDVDGDGIFEKDKKKLEINLMVDLRKATDKKIAMMIRQHLSEVGMKVNFQLYNGEKEIAQNSQKLSQSQAWLRLLSGPESGEEQSARDWYSLSSEFGKLWKYENKKVDELFELSRVTKSDHERAEIYKSLHKIIYDEQPVCFLFYQMGFFAISARFKNTDEFFTAAMPDYVIKDWYVIEE